MGTTWRSRALLTLTAAAVMAVSASLLAVAEPASAGDGGDRDQALAAFARIRDRQADAWYREDGRAFAATFTPEADLVTFNGDHLRTREGIATGMQFYFDNYIDHTRLHTLDEHVRFAGPDRAVIVRTGCQLVPPSTTCRQDSLSRNTNVMVRRHGRWQQDSFQNTRVVALPTRPPAT
jgi:uncharacterized protein (TIGR02246 family)